VTVFLVPAGRDRLELYSESPEDPQEGPRPAGVIRRWIHRAAAQWHAVVEAARGGRPRTRLVRWRDELICRLAETIAEQRSLWGLRTRRSATLRFPSMLDERQARAALMRSVETARQHHLRWFVVDLVLFAGSGVFFFVPGPNLIAYYFAFRFTGHLQSWRGARQAMQGIAWDLVPDDALAELAALVEVPRHVRAPLVASIAERLDLRQLPTFFDRVAATSA
jgi:hypothetical protein